ncbi:MAG: Rid family hydrolase [Vicinamibacterales bacterium]|nr:Rid family hydrolase [Vicinamibacterales bacterium]
MKISTVTFILALSSVVNAQLAVAQQPVRRIQPATAAIATAVWVGDTLYVSGQLPNPITPADTTKGMPAVYGDTKTQTDSALRKIETILKEQGLAMGDVFMMHVYLAADPSLGNKMDFAGMMASYTQFFGTAAQPNKPARSTVQVAALVAAGALVEIEVIAVRSK